MKLRYFIPLLFVFSVLLSCEDYLEKTPDEDMTIDDVFMNPNWIRSFLANIYSWLPNEANFADDGGFRNPFVGGSDEMEIAFGGAFSHMINAGSWNATNIDRVPVWKEAYAAIRPVNIFLEKIDGANATRQQIDEWKGEAYFLRAFFHFLAFRSYGPIPLLDYSVGSGDDWFAIRRRPIDECVAFISQDCDSASRYLPTSRVTFEYGRPSRASALALKSRLLLYAASPLYNGNKDMAGLKDPVTKENLFPQSYDEDKWLTAAKAALEAIEAAEAGGFALYRSADNDPVKNYEEVFTVNWNCEVLFAKNLGDYWHHIWCSDPVSYGTPSIFNPTQNIVDAYRMANGERPITRYTSNGTKPVINPASGYSETGYAATGETGRWPEGVHNMYVGREPRFYASINFAGQIWKRGHELQFWYDGIDGKRNAGSDYCKTGYLMRKINNINITSNPWVVQKTTWIYFRVAELYLNYAEAMNEYSGPVDEAQYYLNAVRERSGLDKVYGGITREQMREELKLERRIELAFETHRFFDVRRWKDAPGSESQPVHSLDIWSGTHKQDDAFYQRILCEERVFEAPKHYFFPIPQEEINKNPVSMVQNPGW